MGFLGEITTTWKNILYMEIERKNTKFKSAYSNHKVIIIQIIILYYTV